LKAELVSVWRDVEVTGAALAERPDSSGWNLVFQRSNSFTDSDRRSGTATYSITNEAGVTVYGGVTSWKVDGSNLNLALGSDAGSQLGLPADVAIALGVEAARIADLSTTLADVLA
jgi:hypothetical protein